MNDPRVYEDPCHQCGKFVCVCPCDECGRHAAIEETMLVAWVINTLESRLARLEEEKAQAAAYMQRVSDDNNRRSYEDGFKLNLTITTLLRRERDQAEAAADAVRQSNVKMLREIDRLEAREAAMQVLLGEAAERLEDVQAVNGNLSVHALDFIDRAKAALSPDAGRALAAEVEKLREVARLSKIVERYGCEVGSQTWSELRDALAKRGEEGE